MFNQKVNAFTSKNPEYLNYSYAAPELNPYNIHTCGTTINKYKKATNCSSLPLQTWCSANIATESFGMRPITNPNQYFESIKEYLATIIYTDSISLKESQLAYEHYYLYLDNGREPQSSFIQAIKTEVIDKLTYYMTSSIDQLVLFKETNPICEGLVLTDIDLTVYRSQENPNHYFYKILFSAFNTTRYNTISFRAEAYQDTTPMMNEWNAAIKIIENSKNVPTDISSSSLVYFSMIDLLNNTSCVTGQESECEFKPYNSSKFNVYSDLSWIQPNAITQNKYTLEGNYDENGQIRIIDYGPDNLDQLIKNIKFT